RLDDLDRAQGGARPDGDGQLTVAVIAVVAMSGLLAESSMCPVVSDLVAVSVPVTPTAVAAAMVSVPVAVAAVSAPVAVAAVRREAVAIERQRDVRAHRAQVRQVDPIEEVERRRERVVGAAADHGAKRHAGDDRRYEDRLDDERRGADG